MNNESLCKYLKKLLCLLTTTLALQACHGDDEALIPLVLPLVSAGAKGAECPEESTAKESDGSAALETSLASVLHLSFRDSRGGIGGLPFRIENQNGRTLYQGLADKTGTASVPVQFQDIIDFLLIRVETATASYSFPVTAPRFEESRYDFVLDERYVAAPDGDQDGIPTSFDYDDGLASMATRIEYQSLQMAFEDLWPVKGDYDFNDVVLKLDFAEIQNARAEIREIEIDVQQLASGAGYDHQICLGLPAAATVDGRAVNPDCLSLIESTRAAGAQNTRPGQAYLPAAPRSMRVVFDQPVTREQLGHAPYDLFIFVKNTGHEIHRPGMRFDSAGRDLYLSADDGSPWTTIYPFQSDGRPTGWPIEGRTMFRAFPKFGPWVQAEGLSDRGWYGQPDDCYVMSVNGYKGGTDCE